MDSRRKDLSEIQCYIKETDKEVTMILQSLQWDRKHILEGVPPVSCKYENRHKMPPDKKGMHEEQCFLKSQGYSAEDKLLPDPLDVNAPTLVKLSKEDIKQIINKAAQMDPMFKRGQGCDGCEPLTAERMLAVYTADERRAIHDAVTSAAPDFYQVQDLSLISSVGDGVERRKTKQVVLSELRDMRRRRTKYRGAASASSNYSHVLRDLITTQMEMYTGVQTEDVSNPNYVLERNDRCSHISSDSISRKAEEIKNHRNDSKLERSRVRDRERSNSVDNKRRRDYEGNYKDVGSSRHSRSNTHDDDEHRSKKHDSRHRLKEERYRDRKRDGTERRDKYLEPSRRRGDCHEYKKERSHKHDKLEESSTNSRKRHRKNHDDTDEDKHSAKYKRYYDH